MARDEPIPAPDAAPRWRWLAATTLAGYWLVMAALMHVPPVFPPVSRQHSTDKWVHAGLYMGLALLLAWTLLGFRRRPAESPRRRAWSAAAWAVVVAMIYGVLDEWTQPLTGRQFEWLDLAADSLGVMAGAVLFGAAAGLLVGGVARRSGADSS